MSPLADLAWYERAQFWAPGMDILAQSPSFKTPAPPFRHGCYRMVERRRRFLRRQTCTAR